MVQVGDTTFYRNRQGNFRLGKVIAMRPEEGRGYLVIAPLLKNDQPSQNQRLWFYAPIAYAEKLEPFVIKQPQQHEYVIIDMAMNVWRSSEYAGQVAVWGGRSGWTCVPCGAQRYTSYAAAQRAHANVAKKVRSCMVVTLEEYNERRVAALESLGLA